MTQPPGQQPPEGGFGAPQDGPEPEHGFQGLPPAGEPGYGYPQHPAGPYQQPGPYGQQPGPYGQQPGPYGQPGPHQQPGPYAPQPGPYQPPGPYGQGPGPYPQQPPPYGYPQQDVTGGPTPPPGGGGNLFRGRPGVVIAAVAAALLVLGGGAWFLLGGESGKEDAGPPVRRSGGPVPSGSPSVDRGDGTGGGRESGEDLNAGRKPGEAKVLWLQKNDVDLPRNGAEVYGPWFAGDTVVKAMYKQVVGYSAVSGKKKWTFPLPAEACAAPVAPSAAGKIVIGYQDGDTDKSECSLLQMLDLATGKPGWKKEIQPRGTFDLLNDITLAISGDTVTAGRTGNSDAYRMSDGRDLFGKVAGPCQPYAFAGGPRLIAAENCPTGDSDTTVNQIQELDPVTGRARWTYKLPKNWEVDKAYSVDPLVISLTNRADKGWSIIALKPDGTLRSQIDGGKDTFQPDCGGKFIIFGRNLEGCAGVAADANSFYMSTAPLTGGLSRTNELVAFDLNTGKARWRSKAPTGRTMMPLRMEGANVLVSMAATFEQASAIATVAPAGGAPKILQQHPAAAAPVERAFFTSKQAFVGGRFYLVNTRVSAGNDAEELETTTMMAFGN